MRKEVTYFSVLFSLILLATACHTPLQSRKKQILIRYMQQGYDSFEINHYSNNSTYGYTVHNPIRVGGAKNNEGPLNEHRFLNSLAGPNGESLTYFRIGSCCPFELNDNAGSDIIKGFLDKYSVIYNDSIEKILYLDIYNSEELKIPVGFKKKNFNIINDEYNINYSSR